MVDCLEFCNVIFPSMAEEEFDLSVMTEPAGSRPGANRQVQTPPRPLPVPPPPVPPPPAPVAPAPALISAAGAPFARPRSACRPSPSLAVARLRSSPAAAALARDL